MGSCEQTLHDRVNALLKFITCNHEFLGGQMVVHWWRCEFQNRGRSQLYVEVWVKDHLAFDTILGIEIMDHVYSCKVPTQHSDLHESCPHRYIHTCRTNNYYTESRFNFPRKECKETRII